MWPFLFPLIFSGLRLLGPMVLRTLGVKSVYVQAFLAILDLLGGIPLTKAERVQIQNKAVTATKMRDMQELKRLKAELERMRITKL